MAQFFTDFSEYTDGVQPSDWTERIRSSEGTTIVTATGAPGGVKALKITKSANNFYGISWDGAGSPSGDVELLWKVQISTVGSTAGTADIGFLHQGGGDTTANDYMAFALGINSATGANLYRVTSGTLNALHTNQPQGVTAIGAWRWGRMQRTGNTVRCRWWADGGAEPGTWNVTATDATYSSGRVGLGVGHNDMTGWFGQFSVGTGGDAAPSVRPPDTTGFFF